MDFSIALGLLRAGKRVACEAWDDGEFLLLGRLDLGGSAMSEDIYLLSDDGTHAVWEPTTQELLRRDWAEFLVN